MKKNNAKPSEAYLKSLEDNSELMYTEQLRAMDDEVIEEVTYIEGFGRMREILRESMPGKYTINEEQVLQILNTPPHKIDDTIENKESIENAKRILRNHNKNAKIPVLEVVDDAVQINDNDPLQKGWFNEFKK